MPDAFTNPEYRRYALKGALAVTICYVLQSAADWPGIRTCIVTCMIVALTSEGATIQKATLRFSGALVGALLGFLAILLLIPGMVSITSLVLLVAAGTAIAGWVNLGSARISYAGVQIAFAFYVCVIQGFAPNWHFDTIRDRLVGILLGNVVITLVFLYVWPVDALIALRRNLAAALRTTAHLATIEDETDDPAALARRAAELRAQADRQFGAVQQALEEAVFEPERDVPPRVSRSTAQSVFLNQLAVARHRPDFAPGVLPAPVRAAIRRLNMAVAERLGAVADRIEGTAESPLAGPPASADRASGCRRGVPGRSRSIPPSPSSYTLGSICIAPSCAGSSGWRRRITPGTGTTERTDDPRSAVCRSPGDAGGDRAPRGLCRMEPAAQHPAVVQPTVGVSGASSRFGDLVQRERASEPSAGVSVDPEKTYELPELIDIAQRTNPETRVAWERARQAAIAVGLAEGTYYPLLAVSATGAAARLALPFPANLIPGGLPNGYLTANTQLVLPIASLEWWLLDFGRRSATVDTVKALALEATVGFNGKHQQIVFAVTRGVLCARPRCAAGGRGAGSARVGADARNGGGGAANARRGNAARGPASARGGRARGIRARGRLGRRASMPGWRWRRAWACSRRQRSA